MSKPQVSTDKERIVFTKEMRRDYTILIPNMAPIHFELLRELFRKNDYNVELLRSEGHEVVDAGLKYVHNDTCYPALLAIGQLMHALESGKYDLNKTALMITQTGGGCRASNYIHLLRKALVKAGLSHIPVISLNLSGLEKNSGFKLTLPMLKEAVALLSYGDMLMLLSNQVRPYEVNEGETDRLLDSWIQRLSAQIHDNKCAKYEQLCDNLAKISAEFAQIEVQKRDIVKVGVVGEVYAKFSPLANNHLEDFLRSQDCEVMLPGLFGFMLFKVDNRLEDIKLYGGSRLKASVVRFLINYMTNIETVFLDSIRVTQKFRVPASYQHVKSLVKGVIGYGSKMGEGWFLTGEMLELIEHGYENIVCCQPFGCLPNHIVGKGMIRKIKGVNPIANIVPIDYDPGATKVNQENRIKLMLAVAKERLEAERANIADYQNAAQHAISSLCPEEGCVV